MPIFHLKPSKQDLHNYAFGKDPRLKSAQRKANKMVKRRKALFKQQAHAEKEELIYAAGYQFEPDI